jgi:hypothetical protein
MATHPMPSAPLLDSAELERPLTRDEWWDLVFSLEGSAKEMLAKVGGGEAWMRRLRDEESESAGN